MTKKQKNLAVKVAKDVLESIGLLDVSAGSGYVTGLSASHVFSVKGSKNQAKELKKVCGVCALGACFLSAVSLTNKFDFEGLAHVSEYSGEKTFAFNAINGKITVNRLMDVFTPEQMVLIECAFEGFGMGSAAAGRLLTYKTERDLDDFYSQVDAAQKFGNKYLTSKKRLAGIMRNIIKNGGEFIPTTKKRTV
jgi:hypothetical protein